MEVLDSGDAWVTVRSSDGQLRVIHTNEDAHRVRKLASPEEIEARLQTRERQLRFVGSDPTGRYVRRRSNTEQLLRETLSRRNS